MDPEASQIRGDNVIDFGLPKVEIAAGRHQHAPREPVEAAAADFDAEARRELRRHVDACLKQPLNIGQMTVAKYRR